MEYVYAVTPQALPVRARRTQILFPEGKVDLPRFEREIRASSGITVALAGAWVRDAECFIAFKGELNDTEVSVLDALVAQHSGRPLPEAPSPKTEDGRPLVAFSKPDASKKTIISHDWTDPTTWYTAARPCTEQVSASDDLQTYALSYTNVIDLVHGKVFNEDLVRTPEGASYRVVVTVNDGPVAERDPHSGEGDYTVDYERGHLVFSTPLLPSDVVKATYFYATTSLFVVKPDAGRALKIAAVEVQFSDDVVLTDSVVFQPMGFADVFAPQLVQAGVLATGTKVPLGPPTTYKSFTDFQSEAVRSYPKFARIGGTNWRASPHEVLVFNWDYVTETALRSDAGVEVHLRLQHDVPFEGWYATATFYCTSEAL